MVKVHLFRDSIINEEMFFLFSQVMGLIMSVSHYKSDVTDYNLLLSVHYDHNNGRCSRLCRR